MRKRKETSAWDESATRTIRSSPPLPRSFQATSDSGVPAPKRRIHRWDMFCDASSGFRTPMPGRMPAAMSVKMHSMFQVNRVSNGH